MTNKTPRRQILKVLAVASSVGSVSGVTSARKRQDSASPRKDDSSTLLDTISEIDLRSIEYGETKQGAIDDQDPTGYIGHYEPVEFHGSNGDLITISMESDIGDTVLGLVDPSGDIVASNDDGGSGRNSEISSFELESDGDYIIIATSYNEGATFEYNLSLTKEDNSSVNSTTSGSDSERDINLRRISAGETKSGVIDQSDPHGYNGYYEPVSFQANEGDEITINMVSDSGDTYLLLMGPDGNRLVEDDDGYGSGYNSKIADYVVSKSGEYTIIATSYNPNAEFEYTLSLAIDDTQSDDNSQPERTTESDSSQNSSSGPSESRIEYGETVNGELDSTDRRGYRGQYDAYTFHGETGDRIEVEMRSPGDTYLILLNSDGTVVERNDDGLSDYNSRISNVELDSSNEYKIIATSYSSDSRFEYELTLRRLSPSSDSQSSTSTSETDRSQDVPDELANADFSEILPLSVASYENRSGPAGSSVELLAFQGDFSLQERRTNRTLSLPSGIPGLFNWDPSGQHLVGSVDGDINLWPNTLDEGFNISILNANQDFHPFFHGEQIAFYRDGLPHVITNTSEVIEAAQNQYSIPPEFEELNYSPAISRSVALNIHGPRGSLSDIWDEEIHLLTVSAQIPRVGSTLFFTLRAGYDDIGRQYRRISGGSPKMHMNIEAGLRNPRRTFFNLHTGTDVTSSGATCIWAYEPALRQHYGVPVPPMRACDRTIDNWVQIISQYINNYRWQIRGYQQINAVKLVYTIAGAFRNAILLLSMIGMGILTAPFTS